jgi:hypothetical protein
MGVYLMAVNTNFKKGVDVPTWVWLQQHPFISTVSCATKYDGIRYIYVVQNTSFYRFDTWSNGWQQLATPTTGGAGQDMVFDSVRNVVIFTSGLALTSWQVFNLNTAAITIAGVVCQPWVLTTMTPILPAACGSGSSLSRAGEWVEGEIVANGSAATTGQSPTTVVTTPSKFYDQLIGLQLRVTSGEQTGQARTILSKTNSTTLVLSVALPGALAIGDTFVIERPGGAVTSSTTLALTATAEVWIVNKYSNWDVEIISGTGSGQRRRIASNTATVITLSSATAGNPRTGPFTTAPDATSVFRIIPSSDFMYYQVGGTTALWRLDVVASPAVWTAMTAAPAVTGAGATTDYSRLVSPGHLWLIRGVATSTIYVYDIGLNTWATFNHFPPPLQTLTTGASAVIIPSHNKLAIYKDLSQQVSVVDLATGLWELFSNHPYIPGTAVEGKRMEYVQTTDGVLWLYLFRAGGQEFWRVPLEWLP